ncbi:putative Cox19 family protein (CHCH motif) [Cocos nucifera]|uniref:Putative Cox19 family protein (CHCH motif) n=1 Tax=Cocos nucifera TaxID=13894 RepID=A0A8K0IJP2_COCNU|nr:putative Cox19 family protein (CHCH motif) [Cocos nucifera]
MKSEWNPGSGLGRTHRAAEVPTGPYVKPHPDVLGASTKETRGTMASSRSISPPASSSPPYLGPDRLSESLCFLQYTASLKCLEANGDKSKCQQQFDDYKECKKKEREARLERNRKKSFFR